MMLLSEMARMKVCSTGSPHTAPARRLAQRLFLLVYGVGMIVTVFLSNDATAVY